MRKIRILATVLTCAVALSVGAAAPAAPAASGPDRAAVHTYLRSIGIDPAGTVFQAGLRNYAGPSCPGAGWTCTQAADGPIVQQADAGGANVFECTGSPPGGDTCVVVQTSTSGNNVARCVLSTQANPVSQSCSITQHNQTGDNTATVDMDVRQSDGQVQSALQAARVVQRSTSGGNRSTAGQKSFQSTGSSGGVQSQSQTAGQDVAVDQRATLAGSNDLSLDQDMVMRAHTSGGTSVVQHQNASSTEPDQDFDVFQSSNGGTNGFNVAQRIDQQAVANRAPAATTQQQGTEQGGQHGALHQESSGISRAPSISQQERQHAVGNGTSGQNQFGPHICCDGTVGIPDATPDAPDARGGGATETDAPDGPENTGDTQEGNPANSLSIAQGTTQTADEVAHQDDLAVGRFRTSGFGTVDQRVGQNGAVNTNSCSGQVCDTSLSCIDGVCDNTPPETTITSAPESPTTSSSATFTFVSSEAGSTFQCKLDAGAYAGCTSPSTYTGLADGSHTFTVRAIDPGGNVDTSPATHTWTIDTAGPQSDFDPGQDGTIYIPGDPIGAPEITGTATDATTGIDDVRVTFTHLILGTSETVSATLDCNPGATACSWSVLVPSFPGQYRATKSAVDAAGNVEPQDETITFIVIP